MSEFIIGRVLNYAAKGVTRKVYNHPEYLDRKRRALDLSAQYLDALTNPPAGNVVALVASFFLGARGRRSDGDPVQGVEVWPRPPGRGRPE